MAKRGPKPKPPRQGFHIGASRVRAAVAAMSDPREKRALLRALWPEMTPRMAELIVEYPEETAVNGSRLLVPRSWTEGVE